VWPGCGPATDWRKDERQVRVQVVVLKTGDRFGPVGGWVAVALARVVMAADGAVLETVQTSVALLRSADAWDFQRCARLVSTTVMDGWLSWWSGPWQSQLAQP
jgi:hypothetical protein